MPGLLVDLYELTMGESYLAEGMDRRPATFQLFCRTLPAGWGYLLAAGIDDALADLEGLSFSGEELAYLESTGLFGAEFLERLEGLRFTGEVRAMREGTVFFPTEPVLEVRAPLLEAQLLETAVINRVHLSSLIASRAARCVDVAGGRTLVEFGFRRAHGAEAGVAVARASYLAGFDATSNVLAGERYGIPVAGTMAHSYIETFADETAAFEAFTRSYPDGATLLIDTYDTVEGARRAAAAGRELAARGGRLGAVRLDSGDLLDLSTRVRAVLDDEGLPDVTIFASGNLDEYAIAALLEADAPIDGFGVGSRLATSAGAPYLDLVYKLVDFDGRGVMKFSADKATLPGSKQVWRRIEGNRFAGEVITLADEQPPVASEPLLEPAMSGGRRVREPSLAAARERAATQRSALPPASRQLEATQVAVTISSEVERLREAVTARLARS
ncbi:MAG TPA: nicotinate phosphoribosyltransferase [Gaiellaceae bacterium]|jgi:nicotinate phosphoribosyltransferase|nr:nicotinate phosphoribosyltransferase [Gaiellaceae bacterium]